ncbi:acyloxyacyl hydrolase [Fulvivirga sp. M361]|uniref:acyloxyacyl hydrolase n=1 Tax=Fulvivirga sp. M361 TaxID=2594266 RepID=UPI00117B72EB|nr:acyloxyacyl hydrolase [Fulvivirga sp. M361]TRX60834.1 acyloxyacyl hydrolase [Fulvivirga sp. M361]
MKWTAIPILISFLMPGSIYGQEDIQNPTIFGARSHYGFIIPHSSELKNISQTNPWGFQIEWSKLMVKDKSWNNCNCYAQTGLSFTYFNHANPKQLGNSYNLIYFVEPYLSFNRKLFYSFRAGTGVTFLDKVHDEVSNPDNTFYSSPISFLLLMNFNINYRITNQYTASITAQYNHISNGGMKQPNKGMNFPTFGLGISYSPNPTKLQRKPTLRSKKGTIDGYARLFGTLPNVEATEQLPDKRKLLIGLSGGALWYMTNFNALNLGVELVRDESHREAAARAGKSDDHHLIGITLGHNFVFGKFTFNQQLGYYAYKPFPFTSKDFYQRYELLYLIGKKYQVGTSLKAHGHVAENLDVRFGILF